MARVFAYRQQGRAASRAWRACARLASGYVPTKTSNFSFPSMRYFWRHRPEPVDLTKKEQPFEVRHLTRLVAGLQVSNRGVDQGHDGASAFSAFGRYPKKYPQNRGYFSAPFRTGTDNRTSPSPNIQRIFGCLRLNLDVKVVAREGLEPSTSRL